MKKKYHSESIHFGYMKDATRDYCQIHLPAAKVTINCSPLVHSARGFGTTYLMCINKIYNMCVNGNEMHSDYLKNVDF